MRWEHNPSFEEIPTDRYSEKEDARSLRACASTVSRIFKKNHKGQGSPDKGGVSAQKGLEVLFCTP